MSFKKRRRSVNDVILQLVLNNEASPISAVAALAQLSIGIKMISKFEKGEDGL